MYEKLLLESGKVFKGRRVSGIGVDVRVVDDTQTVLIPVFIPEGMAEIVNVDYPATFTPGVIFNMTTTVKNIGTYEDDMFVNIDNITPGYEANIGSQFQRIPKGETRDFIIPVVAVVQEIDLSAIIEAGHVEQE